MSRNPDLFLVPTEPERQRLRAIAGADAVLVSCGFGPVVAAARTSTLIAELAPRRVILVGIAGTLRPDRLPVGTAAGFRSVALDGLGTGHDQTPLFPQWPGDDHSPSIHDRLPLAYQGEERHLLTVGRSSADDSDVEDRRRRFPDADAEDMEGFGVAAACALAERPLHIVRGVSNLAGDRDHARWEIDAALEAAWICIRQLPQEPDA